MTSEELKAINEKLATIPFEKGGKTTEYVTVNERVKAFRELCPNGSIITEILKDESGVVTMQATVRDEDGKILGTGLAQEKENAGFINKTSHIENCETSAVGRALGFCGIGIDGSMASADELANALKQQGEDKKNTAGNEASGKTKSEEKKKSTPIPSGYPSRDDMVRVCEEHYKGDNLKALLNHYNKSSINFLKNEELVVAYNTATGKK